MPPKSDSIGGLKITPGLWTVAFRTLVMIFSLAGTVVVASYWLQSDKHNDARYVLKTDLETYKNQKIEDTKHLLEILNLRFTRLDEKLADIHDDLQHKANK